MNEKDFIREAGAQQGLIRKIASLYAADAEERKDLCQEIMYQAWKARDSFRGESKFSTWLYRIALNTVFSIKRKTNRVEYHEQFSASMIPAVNENASERMEVQALFRAIRSLTETDRALISLHLDGYSNTEIASIMGISANHTGVKLYRIKNELKQKLQS